MTNEEKSARDIVTGVGLILLNVLGGVWWVTGDLMSVLWSLGVLAGVGLVALGLLRG